MTCCKRLLLQGPSLRPKAVAYQVPADFDKSVLGEVDLTTLDAAETGLANAFWLRWMQLRKEASLKQLPGPTCLLHAFTACLPWFVVARWQNSRNAQAKVFLPVGAALLGMLCQLHIADIAAALTAYHVLSPMMFTTSKPPPCNSFCKTIMT